MQVLLDILRFWTDRSSRIFLGPVLKDLRSIGALLPEIHFSRNQDMSKKSEWREMWPFYIFWDFYKVRFLIPKCFWVLVFYLHSKGSLIFKEQDMSTSTSLLARFAVGNTLPPFLIIQGILVTDLLSCLAMIPLLFLPHRNSFTKADFTWFCMK